MIAEPVLPRVAIPGQVPQHVFVLWQGAAKKSPTERAIEDEDNRALD
jgi:hypothetical protein